jgi:hypothetical protein
LTQTNSGPRPAIICTYPILPPNIGLTGKDDGTAGYQQQFFPAKEFRYSVPDNDLLNEHPYQTFHECCRLRTTLTYTDNVILSAMK